MGRFLIVFDFISLDPTPVVLSFFTISHSCEYLLCVDQRKSKRYL